MGLGFRDREPAFDLNVALSDNDKQLLRAKEVQAASSGEQVVNPRTDAATLYTSRDMRLKEGQTIRHDSTILALYAADLCPTSEGAAQDRC